MDFFYNSVLGLFLYFPEDKTEYIPAGITTAIFLLAAVFTWRLIMKHSKKEEGKLKKLEEQILQKNQEK
ncbi:hypothetical protein [Bacillus massiliigorillae]|uniref:hypothetical protein n=1 Tax=Bacillus massiliigorillae TaxID=1243664 RepID=UPI0003AA701D|nr:hypothetical protein [Bacillus massiliigorillae]